MKFLQLALMFLIILFFIGCAGSAYNIDVSGEKNSNQAFIEFSDQCVYRIDDVIKYETSTNMSGNDLISDLTKTKVLSKSICNQLTFYNRKIRSSNYWFINSTLDDMLSSKSNCNLDNTINGISFLKCNGSYRIVSSDIKDQGYDNKSTLYTTKKCFEELKNKASICQRNSNSNNKRKSMITSPIQVTQGQRLDKESNFYPQLNVGNYKTTTKMEIIKCNENEEQCKMLENFTKESIYGSLTISREYNNFLINASIDSTNNIFLNTLASQNMSGIVDKCRVTKSGSVSFTVQGCRNWKYGNVLVMDSSLNSNVEFKGVKYNSYGKVGVFEGSVNASEADMYFSIYSEVDKYGVDVYQKTTMQIEKSLVEMEYTSIRQ